MKGALSVFESKKSSREPQYVRGRPAAIHTAAGQRVGVKVPHLNHPYQYKDCSLLRVVKSKYYAIPTYPIMHHSLSHFISNVECKDRRMQPLGMMHDGKG